MSNHIRQVVVQNHRLDPVQTEIWIWADADHFTPTTELRGRLVGPRCDFSSTVETAYPLRRFQHPPQELPDSAMRVIVPEAGFWDLDSPFYYQVFLELWEDGRRCDQRRFNHALRTLSLGSRGLRLNGRDVAVRGAWRDVCSEKEMQSLRQAGYNTLYIPLENASESLWDAANRCGMLVLGRLTDLAQLPFAVVAKDHACCLGWVVGASMADRETLAAINAALGASEGNKRYVGLEANDEPIEPTLSGFAFLVGDKEKISSPAIPKIVLQKSPHDEPSHDPNDPPGTFGWIRM